MFNRFILSLLSLVLFETAFAGKPVFTPVSGFEVEKYLGKWFEIARFQHKFEKDLVNVTATYTLRDDGKIDVLNQGYKGTRDGKLKSAKGKAKFAGAGNIGHLKVSFFWPFYADYIIVELDKVEYQYALVVSNSYDYLWVLCREPKLDEDILNSLLDKARKLGFDTSKVFIVPQDWE